MKNKIIALLLLLSAAMYAQDDKTLFSDVNRVGAFGAPIFEFSDLDGDIQTTSGGGGALILNDFFLGGYGMSKAEYSRSSMDGGINLKENLNFKHGGFWLGYTPLQEKVIHPYGSMRLGWGKARYSKTDLSLNETLREEKDNVFVMTPEVGFEINVFSFFRIVATGSYRWVNGIDSIPNYSEKDLSSFAANLTLRFGGFGSEWKWN
ncbi:MAG: hypothetical protein H6577_24970 [Lewinellaceae bacterium]|nr:hypothetical protein [Saprospiraceae bacterium]MCB9341390.1 hypothetical protein [Lewinellaceae bacterium]